MGEGNAPWNSVGAITSTLMIGSKMVGAAFWKASLTDPTAAMTNASSDESTAWKAPSSSTYRTPVMGEPYRGPLAQACLKPCSWRNDEQ